MSLAMGQEGFTYRIIALQGRDHVCNQLNNMGFVPGTEVKIIKNSRSNFIVLLKQCRMGIGGKLAEKIIVEAKAA